MQQIKSKKTEIEKIESSNKMTVIFQIIKECSRLNEKLLIFSAYTQTLDLIEEFMGKDDENSFDYYRLDGSTSDSERHRLISDFNNPAIKTNTFLLSTAAGGIGINLTGANRIIMVDCSWNPAIDRKQFSFIIFLIIFMFIVEL